MHHRSSTRLSGTEPPASAAVGTARRYLAALAFALAGLPAGAADRDGGPFSLVIKPGGFDERCLRLRAGEAIDFRFASDTRLDFNIHYHRDREVFYPVRQAAVREASTVRFVAPATDDYCLMWENRGGAPAKLEGQIDRVG
jgi:hypothetical protein